MVALSRYYPSEELLNAPEAMMPSQPQPSSRRSCGMSWAIDPKVLGEKTQTFLKSRHPQKTASNVVIDTDGRLKESQVERWLEGASAPSGAALIVLISAYGPEFLAAVFPSQPAWLDAARRSESVARLDAEIADLQAKRQAVASL